MIFCEQSRLDNEKYPNFRVWHKCRLLNQYVVSKGKYGWLGYITIWDCGKYGRLVSEDTHVFKWAHDESMLLLERNGVMAMGDQDIHIFGIKDIE